ncbi:MAG: DegV family protein [Clostridia bacterium]|nr:DegV family protein [Clostridia bacterium]
MRDFVIIGDSTCDLPSEIRSKYNIEYLKMYFVANGEEHAASLDWEEYSPKEFYDLMRNGVIVKTTQVPREEFVNVFTYWLEQGKDILYVSCSSGLSGSVGLANVVAAELSEKYADAKICCVDSLISSLGQGMLLVKAALMRNEGKSIDEIVCWLEENRLKVNQCGTVDSLEYLRRAGRVTAASAFLGNVFGIKPLIISDINGHNYAYRKVKGAVNARKEMAKDTVAAAEDAENSILCISHGDALAEAEKLRDEVLALRKFKQVYITNIGPIVGASVGPGTLITYVYGKPVTIEGKE